MPLNANGFTLRVQAAAEAGFEQVLWQVGRAEAVDSFTLRAQPLKPNPCLAKLVLDQ